jgi:hypothetical protein
MQYRWLNRFLSGRIGMFRHALNDGTTNTGLSWQHTQNFSDETHLSANINYVTNTFVQRTTSFNPATVLASITSTASYDTKIGPAALSLGGTRSQHPGRGEVNQTFPTLSLSAPTIGVAKWLDWTPSFNYSTQQDLNIDDTGEFAYRFFTNASGAPDSVRLKRNSRNTTSSFRTPLKIGGFSWNNSFVMNSREIDEPLTIVVVDPEDSTKKASRVFAKTFPTSLDWQTSFGLPSFLHGTLNLSPSISLENVDGNHGFWVRSELSGGQFHESRGVSDAVRAVARVRTGDSIPALHNSGHHILVRARGESQHRVSQGDKQQSAELPRSSGKKPDHPWLLPRARSEA